jgi:PQQ-dependent catabolism-associated CXXCW motif protein
MTLYPAARYRPLHARVAAALLLALAVPVLAQQDFGQTPTGAGAYPSAPPPAGGPGYPPPVGNPNYPPPAAGFPPGTAVVPPNAMPGMTPPPNALPGGYPPPPGAAMPPGGASSAAPAQTGAMQALLDSERRDYGVAPQPQLQTNLHGPTPTSIPGGQVITTDRLLALYQQGAQSGLIVFHVLGPGPMLPNAQNAAPASQPGSFDDQTQQQFGQYLQQVTQGNRARPLVFYCQSTQCWMSYNAALRAIRMGFTQVYWYRGGIEAWQQMQQLSGGAPAPNGGGYGGQMPNPPMPNPPRGDGY